MSEYATFDDIGVDLADFVATIEIRRPPHNFFDIALINQIADALALLGRHAGGGAALNRG